MPQEGVRGAGFPVLERARHVTVFEATRETGAYNHHSQLAWHDGSFHAHWSNHPHGEDGPGQRVLYSSSPDAEDWSEPRELFAPPGPLRQAREEGLALTAFGSHVVDGKLYALAGCHARL